MPITLGANIASLKTQRVLGQATDALSRTYERLASGQRINHASDDAAGLAIASQLHASARVFTQAIRNVNDGLSAASIAEGALNALKDVSQRQLELAEQAANGTYSVTQRRALNNEANTLVREFNRIAGSTTFNGMNLLDPNLGAVVIQAGFGQGGMLSLGVGNDLQRPTGNGNFTFSQSYGGNYSLAAADFNGDGNVDFITLDGFNNSAVYLSNGDGTFRQSAGPWVSPGYSAYAADLTNDGRIDILNFDGTGLYLAVGNGDGTFRDSALIKAGDVGSATLADFNSDGKLDIGVGNRGGSLDILLGNGNGSFRSAVTYAINDCRTVTSGDFNGDGIVDLIGSSYSGGFGVVLLGRGNGSFSVAATISIGAHCFSMNTGDFNGDGLLDLFSVTGSTQNLLYFGNGDGSFRSPVDVISTYNSWASSTADINSDGIVDIIVSSDSYSQVLFGNIDGTFSSGTSVAIGSRSGSGAVAFFDANGDGRLDITGTGYGGGQVGLGDGGTTTGIAYLNITTQAGARDALNTVRASLDRVQKQLGAIGATTSRFSFALGTLQAQRENYLAAAGRIQDADIASESADLVRRQIQQQAAASVLAQANLVPQLALKLLQ